MNTEPIRVLHMIGSLNIGGSQSMILSLYQALDKSKIQFDFIIDHAKERFLAEQVEDLGARVYTMPCFNGSNFNKVKKAWNRFFEEHPEYKILHSHVRSYASVYLPIAKKHGVKTIIHSHSTSNGTGIKAAVKACLQYPLRHQADYFFSCSEDAGRWLFGNKVVGSERHFVLKNAIDALRYRFSEPVRNEYREELKLEDNDVYIHVGRFCAAKNHAFLLRVFKRIYAQNPNARLLLAGTGELEQECCQQVKMLGIDQAVQFLGNRNDVARLLQAADCFLFPSLWEGLGIVAVEAQAAGLPCLCSDSVPDLVKVTDQCQFLALDEELWAQHAVLCSAEQRDTYSEIVAAGYDVSATAAWLQDFYCKVWEE